MPFRRKKKKQKNTKQLEVTYLSHLKVENHIVGQREGLPLRGPSYISILKVVLNVPDYSFAPKATELFLGKLHYTTI